MRLLDRYLLRELVVPLGCCLSGFLIFWTAFNLFQDLNILQDHKMLIGDVVQYYLVKTPEFLVVILPVALLLALLYTLTTHARHNEITAIRGAGVSLWRLTRPYFIVGLVASGVLLVLGEFFVPDSVEWSERIMNRHTKDPVTNSEKKRTKDVSYSVLSEDRSWQIDYFNYKKMELVNPLVNWKLPDGSRRWLSAERAIYTNNAWVFFKAQEFKDPPAANEAPIRVLKTNELTMREFRETPEDMRDDIRISARITLRGGLDPDIPIAELLDYLHQHPNLPLTERNWLYTKLHGRFAAPWTCLVVVLMAIPFGAASGRRNVFVGVASAVTLCFAYFILMRLGLALGMSGRLSPILAGWLPNIVFAVTGTVLTFRVK